MRPSSVIPHLSFVSFVACSLALSSPARSQSLDRVAAAEALFEQGRTLVEAGQLADACPRFLASQQLDPGVGTLLWLADCYALTGRRAQAEALFERLLSLRNDVGLLAEEYDPRTRRMLGNFPQALTHMALVNSARLLSMPEHEAHSASAEGERPTSVAAQAAAAGAHDARADDAMAPKLAKVLTESPPHSRETKSN